MSVITYTLLELVVSAFIVWRVGGVGLMFAVFAWRTYREQQRARHLRYVEHIAFRVKCGMPPSEAFRALRLCGFTFKEAADAFRRLGQ